MNPDDWRDTPVWCWLLLVPMCVFLLFIALAMGERIKIDLRK